MKGQQLQGLQRAHPARSCWHSRSRPLQEPRLGLGAAAFGIWRTPVLRQRRAGAVAVAGGSPVSALRCCHELQLKWLLKMKEVEDFR